MRVSLSHWGMIEVPWGLRPWMAWREIWDEAAETTFAEEMAGMFASLPAHLVPRFETSNTGWSILQDGTYREW